MKNNNILFLFLLLFCIFVINGQDLNNSDAMSVGIRLMDLGEFESAAQSFSIIISRGLSDHVATYMFALEMRAHAYLNAKHYDLAIIDYTELIRLLTIYFPHNQIGLAETFCWRGRCYQLKEDYSEASKDFEKSLQISPTSKAHEFIARTSMIFYFNIINTLRSDDTISSQRRRTYIDEKNRFYNSALISFRKAIELDPDNDSATDGLGMLQFLRENRDNF